MEKTQPTLIFTNRYFYPDESATSQILSDLAFYLGETGFTVKIITSRLSYGNSTALYDRHEFIKNVEIIRIKTTRFGRQNLLGRSFDYLSFYIFAMFAYLKHVKKNDVLIAKTDPPLLGIMAHMCARMKGAKSGNWLQDIYPEIAEASGLPLIKGPFANLLRRLRNRALQRSDFTVVIGDRMKSFLETQNLKSERITIIPNWCDDIVITPQNLLDNTVRKAWGFSESDFVIGYSGNLGRAHDLETLIQTAIHLKDQPHIKFLFVGGGNLHATLQTAIKKHGLTQIILKPYQPRKDLALSLSAANIHWLSLKPEFEGKILPSKFYGIAAAGRPMLFIGDKDGEIAHLLNQYMCGFSFAIHESDALTKTILALQSQSDEVERLGQNAHQMLKETLTKKQALQRWETLLKNIL